MSLSSSSSLSDAIDQYLDNLSWEGDPDKAVLALEAVRFVLLKRPSHTELNDRRVNYESLADEKKRLEDYVQRMGDTAAAARASFVRARGVSI